jgi:hypothetical protein
VQTRSGAEIVVDGDVVYKLHRPGTNPSALAARLRIAAESGFLLTPLGTQRARRHTMADPLAPGGNRCAAT